MIVANIFGPDLLLVLVIAFVLLFGAARLPAMARSLVEARRELEGTVASPASDDRITTSRAELGALIDRRLGVNDTKPVDPRR